MQRTTAQIAQVARDSAESKFNVFERKAGKFAWRPIPGDDGGMFESLETAPAWSARVEYRLRVGDGVSCCDIQITDHGSHREVEMATANSLGQKKNAKKLLEGIREALN